MVCQPFEIENDRLNLNLTSISTRVEFELYTTLVLSLLNLFICKSDTIVIINLNAHLSCSLSPFNKILQREVENDARIALDD